MPRIKSEKVREMKLEQKLDDERRNVDDKIPEPKPHDGDDKPKVKINTKPRRKLIAKPATAPGELIVAMVPTKNSPYRSFAIAMKMFVNGKYVARKHWKDYYLCKTNVHDQMVIADPKRNSYRIYVPTTEDITSEDWYVI